MKNLTFYLLLIFITAGANLTLRAQVTEEWEDVYYGLDSLNDNAKLIGKDNTGNIYTAGYTEKTTLGNYDILLIKYSSSGSRLWVSTYAGEGQGTDSPFAMAIDGLGNVYLTGMTTTGNGPADLLTLKYNANGVLQWTHKYNGPGNNIDIGYDICLDYQGNVYVTGSSFGGYTSYDAITIKYSNNGVVQWLNRFNWLYNEPDAGRSIKADNQGYVYVVGYCGNGPNFGRDYLLLKYNTSTGLIAMTKTYNYFDYDMATFIEIDHPGNIYVTGISESGRAEKNIATLKYNSSGQQLWVQRYNGIWHGDDIVSDMALDQSGNIIVNGTGMTTSGLLEYVTIKYSSNGTQQWLKKLGTVKDENSSSISIDNNGNIYMCGSMFDNTTSFSDILTAKYSPNGVLQWTQLYNSSYNKDDYGNSIAAGDNGDVFICGKSIGAGNLYDAVTIKYSEGSSRTTNIETPENYSLSQNYPNPFNPSTKIKFSIPAGSEKSLVKLSVYDVAGRQVSQLVNNELSTGSYEYTFDGTKYTSGVYFYKLQAGDFIETKKMMLVK